MNDRQNQQTGRRPIPTRRDAIGSMLAAFGLTALGSTERLTAATGSRRATLAPVANQKFLVVVELDGGNDGLNTVVPQGLPSYATVRPSLALDSSETLAIDTGPHATTQFRLHGSMTRMADLYRQGELAIVNKVGYPDANGSHDTSKEVWAAGQRDNLIGSSGWIARYADLAAPTSLGAIALRRGRHRSLAGGNTNPLTLDQLSSFRFDNDGPFSANHRHRLAVIRQLLDARSGGAGTEALRTGHALADQIAAAVTGYSSTAAYGTSRIGIALRDIATLLQADFATRVFYTGFGGFDTHAAQGRTTGQHANLLGQLDEAVGAFSDDLKAMGIWQNCVLVVISEFGRRNFENGSGGTDHGKGNCVLLTGGAVVPGLHGEAPSDADLNERSLPYAVDFRAIYSDILATHLGFDDPGRVFSEAYTSPVQVAVV